MPKPANSLQTIDFRTGWRDWWANVPVPESLPFGTVLRVDVMSMIGEAASWTESSAQSLFEKLGETLDDLLAGNATYWSPVPGLVDIHYGTLKKQAAELKHSVVASAVERCVRAAMENATGPSDGGRAAVVRRVDWEKFEAICAKAKARTDQVQILDVSEALFGSPDPDLALSSRIWNEVDEILDRLLASGGYCTRYSRNRVLLFFPGYSKAMGDLKRKAIAAEITSAAGGLVDRARKQDSEPDQSADDPARREASTAPRQSRATPAATDMDSAARAAASQAFAAMAAARDDSLPDPSELRLAPEFDIRPVPMWWAKKRTVGGYVLEPVGKAGEEWDRYFPADPAEPDPLDLPFLARGIARIQEQVATGKASLVVVPVHWPYLDRAKQRDRYVAYCARLPEAARRLLVLELVGMPEDLMQARVEERIAQMRSCCRAITCRVRLARRDFSQFKKLPIYAVGVDFGELPDYERGIIPGFDAFMDAVEPLKLKTYANGLTTKSLLVAVQAAGVDYVAGPVIPDSDEAPLGIRDFAISDLYDTPEER